ncbi:MAG: carboxy terminal-processing peptidase [Cytophagaceae bacterium]|uniref:carboxy terminal-processing peptidase n=1 Tax=Aquirufa regiilacus TaxID=3024868 RepID=UPI001B6F78FE|nr:carboxy terminal-processing peptidase [Aquirufa sp. LEPPI-3A]MBP6055474.1 carboxy terminal-processing peptidase [Cytophagaceae bacterium]MBP6094593.1 carboxy terminal-processing peptidase [Cytophagaceae bacterium]MDT8886937.1 carboxy terminal-processing peptidase [Aquirufa sp. LEPPI-3A]
MKRILPILIPLSLLVVVFLHGKTQGKLEVATYQQGDLQPTDTQRKVERLVFGILSNYHYRKVPVNDSLSSKIFDAYLKNLDPNKVYFLASDIEEVEKYRFTIDEQLNLGDLTSAFQIYNLYQKRMLERFAYVDKIIKQPMDFTLDETYQPDREKAAWAKSSADLDDYWRKDVKRQLVDWKIGGKADTTAVRELNDRYKRSAKYMARTRAEDVFQVFMNAYTESIDPHTSYMIPKAAQEFNKDMAQSFEGIGATLRLEGDYVTIQDLVPGGPAFRSKQINPKDRIVGVAQGDDGAFVDVIGWFTDDAVKLIRGPKGTVVRLKILPGSGVTGSPTSEVRIVREKIKLEEQTAKKEILNFKQGASTYKLGLITIPMFYRDFEGARKREADFKSTSADVRKFLNEFKQEGIDGLVIDLRNNGGGSLIEAVELTGLFIPKGPVVQRKQSDGKISQEVDRDPMQVYDGPMAIMINRFSASASEIFAAAIQDYKRGIIVGEQSYGKGTVQSVIDLDNYMANEKDPVGQLKITLEKFYRVNGSSTQHKGVSPDFALPSAFSAEEFGESSQPSALPWDMIPTTAYVPTNNIVAPTLAQLQAAFQARLKTKPDLIKLKQDFERWKKIKEQNSISLNMEKRKKELDEQKKKPDESQAIMDALGATEESPADKDKKEKAADKHAKDAYLKETQQILSDWISSGAHKIAKVK